MSLAFEARVQKRALMLKKVRAFFDERSCYEVDTPLLSKRACIDTHIDLFEVSISEKETGYLHSSPEYAMKELLSQGSGDIYQLSHVYRKNEQGSLHHPIFTLIEWYRINTSYNAFIREACEVITLFIGPQPYETLSYEDAFLTFLKLNPFNASKEELIDCAKKRDIDLSSDSKDFILSQLWALFIEPHLGKKALSIITDYPPSQAALAKIHTRKGKKCAERFEIYYQGIELGNGYHELDDPQELKMRLDIANKERVSLGKQALPLDHSFLKAVENLPDCYGIAIGFDRLMMLQSNRKTIREKNFPYSTF